MKGTRGAERVLIPAPAAIDAPLDLAPLLELFESDEVGLLVFLIAALHELEVSLANFANSVAARDARLTQDLAHGIKGAAGNIGANGLATAMLLAERAAETQDWKAVDNALLQGTANLCDSVTWAQTRRTEL